MAGKLSRSRLIPAPPAIVTTITAAAFDYLNTLATADFVNTSDPEALWAVAANDTGEEGSVYPSTGGTAATWIVSSMVFRRLRALRF